MPNLLSAKQLIFNYEISDMLYIRTRCMIFLFSFRIRSLSLPHRSIGQNSTRVSTIQDPGHHQSAFGKIVFNDGYHGPIEGLGGFEPPHIQYVLKSLCNYAPHPMLVRNLSQSPCKLRKDGNLIGQPDSQLLTLAFNFFC